MHKEILSKNQLELLPIVKLFKREFYLVDGTAIALHLGHRRSIDFDLFKQHRLVLSRILSKMAAYQPYTVTRRVDEQLNLTLNDVKFTFSEKLFRAQLSYFNDIDYSEEVEYIVKQPSDKEIREFLTETAIDIL